MDSHRLLAPPEGPLNQCMTQIETSDQMLNGTVGHARNLTVTADESGGVLDSLDQKARLEGLAGSAAGNATLDWVSSGYEQHKLEVAQILGSVLPNCVSLGSRITGFLHELQVAFATWHGCA